MMRQALDRLRRFASSALKQVGIQRGPQLVHAQLYTATDPVSGQLQFELLKREGCVPTSKVGPPQGWWSPS